MRGAFLSAADHCQMDGVLPWAVRNIALCHARNLPASGNSMAAFSLMVRVLHCLLSHAIVSYIANCMLFGRLSAVGRDGSTLLGSRHMAWLSSLSNGFRFVFFCLNQQIECRFNLVVVAVVI